MRWYQHLFWRIFGAVWLVSSLGIVLSVSLFYVVMESRDLTERQTSRVTIVAEQIIDRYALGLDTQVKRKHKIPLWIYAQSQEKPIYAHNRPQPDDALELSLNYAGRDYRILYLPDRDIRLLERVGGFWLSLQALWLLAITLGSSLFVTWLVVRPINELTLFIRGLHHQGSLETRAEGHLIERQDELGELAREFNQMIDFVEQTLTTQRHLLQDVSHELRAPLARLQAAAGLAEQRWGYDDRSVKRIHTECEHLDALISEILTLAKARAEDAQSPIVSVMALLERQVEGAMLLGPQHTFALDTSTLTEATQLPSEPFGRIVNNVLNNAVNHTPEGTKISVIATIKSDQLNLCVSDDGPGVSDALINSLGQPFRRGQTSSGFGLGLSIVKRELENIGGSVRFSHQEGGGFRVDITMPLMC